MAVWTVTTVVEIAVSTSSRKDVVNVTMQESKLTGLLLLLLEELGDLVTDIAIGHADIVLLAIIVVQVKETIIRDIDLQIM